MVAVRVVPWNEFAIGSPVRQSVGFLRIAHILANVATMSRALCDDETESDFQPEGERFPKFLAG